MSFTHLNYANEPPTTLSGGVSATITALPINSVTWPLVCPFEVTIDRGNLNQEVCMVVSGATSTNLPVIRNYDGNGAYGHNAGATVEMSATAVDWGRFNTHATDPTRDDHLNLMRADGTRHNTASHHQMGLSLPGGPVQPSNPGDLQDDGEGTSLAYADHVHKRGDTWATYLNFMIRPGMIFPAGLTFSDRRFIPCDGRWLNQDDWPLAFLWVGLIHEPIIPGPQITSPFNPLVHFAVPALGNWDSLFQNFTWFQETQWVMMASF